MTHKSNVNQCFCGVILMPLTTGSKFVWDKTVHCSHSVHFWGAGELTVNRKKKRVIFWFRKNYLMFKTISEESKSKTFCNGDTKINTNRMLVTGAVRRKKNTLTCLWRFLWTRRWSVTVATMFLWLIYYKWNKSCCLSVLFLRVMDPEALVSNFLFALIVAPVWTTRYLLFCCWSCPILSMSQSPWQKKLKYLLGSNQEKSFTWSCVMPTPGDRCKL